MTTQPPPGDPATGFDVQGVRDQVAREARVLPNLGQDVLVVPANVVMLRLREFEDTVKTRTAWQGPTALAAGCLANILSLHGATEFGTLFGMNRDLWMGANVGGLAIFSIAGAYRGFQAVRATIKGDTVRRCVDALRAAQPPDGEA